MLFRNTLTEAFGIAYDDTYSIPFDLSTIIAYKNQKVPYTIILGDKDLEAGKVTLESRDEGQVGQLTLEEILERFKKES